MTAPEELYHRLGPLALGELGKAHDVGEQHRNFLRPHRADVAAGGRQLVHERGRKVTREVGALRGDAGLTDQQGVRPLPPQREDRRNEEEDDHLLGANRPDHGIGIDDVAHAGDIGDLSVMNALPSGKVIRGVYGNIDDPKFSYDLKTTQKNIKENIKTEKEDLKKTLEQERKTWSKSYQDSVKKQETNKKTRIEVKWEDE